MKKPELELIIETVPDAVTVVDSSGNITFANSAAEMILGFSRSEIMGQAYNSPMWKITAPEGEPFPEEKLPVALVAKYKQPIHDLELAIEHPDGKRVILSINAAPVLDEKGNVERVVTSFTDITERKRAEDALRISEERYRMAQAIGYVGNWEYDPQTTGFWGSDEAKRIYGFDPKQHDFTTEEVESHIPERKLVHQTLVDLIEKGKAYNLEFEIIPENSTEPRVIASAAELQRDEHGNLLKVEGVIQDITDRKRAEDELRKSEQKYRELFEESLDGIFITTPERKTLDVNKKLLEIFGYDAKDEFMNLNIARDVYVNPEDRKQTLETVNKEGLAEFEIAAKKKSGEEIIVHIALTAARDESGNITLYRGLIRDVTEQKKTESALRDTERSLRTLVDNIPDNIARFDADCRYLFVSRAVTKMLGRPPEYFIGKTLADSSEPGDEAQSKQLECMIKQVFKDGIPNTLEAEWRTLKGMRYVSIMHVPEKDENGKVVSVLGIARDITEAVRNARLYENEHSIADTLQEALLAAPEHIEGIEYDCLYRSATETAKVGGDFFDIFDLENNRVGIIIGDVSGKGLQAASITALVKNTIRAYAYEEESPASILARTNNTIKKSTPASYFVTLFFGVLDIKTGRIVYCSAGYPPALLKKKAGVETLSDYSPILGAFLDMKYTEGVATVGPGDMLVLYTDGITEARRGSEFFGEERLIAFLNSLELISAKDTIQSIFDEVMRFTGGALLDDAILLSIAASDVD